MPGCPPRSPANGNGRGCGARPDRRRAARAHRAPRGWERAVRRCGRDRGRADDRVHGHEPDPRDRPREPRRSRPAGRHSTRTSRPPWPRSASSTHPIGELRDVHDRGQPRDERGRPVLRQVRPDARLRPLARGRDGGRHGDPHRRPQSQGRGGLLADASDRREPGHAGIITEATVRLRPTPPPRATMLAFSDAGERRRRGGGIAAAGLSPVTLELLDRFTIRAVDDMHQLGSIGRLPPCS